jgi:hypothetical protein
VIMVKCRHLCKLLTSINSHLDGFGRRCAAPARGTCATRPRRRWSQRCQQG